MIFFTADTHFSHENIIKYCQRPFQSVKEMDNTLIDNWNQVVGKEDTVYHLGDFGLFGRHYQKCSEIIDRLNGKIILIAGHHDRRYLQLFEEVYKVLKVKGFTLSHYPNVPCGLYGGVLLHGHVHCLGKGAGSKVNVGVDVWDFKPVSLEEVRDEIFHRN